MKGIINELEQIEKELYGKYGADSYTMRGRMHDIREQLSKALNMHVVIKRIEEYAPKKIELPKFDLTKKGDYIYCIEWGEKKAKNNEYLVYKKLLKELKDKYVL